MNQELFQKACDQVINSSVLREGIGTLSEKTVHAVLKNYYEPNSNNHEIKVGRFFADVYNEYGIIEIQTRQFNKLRAKLTTFLKDYMVTVVYPVTHEKILYWIDDATGEISKGRRSPKRGNCYAIFPELYRIKMMLKNDNIRFCIALIDVEEYRVLDGWSKDRKKGATLRDRIPTKLVEEIYINSLDDYENFIPLTLKPQFDSKEFAKEAKIPKVTAQVTLNILTEVGAVVRVGKRGNSILYQRK